MKQLLIENLNLERHPLEGGYFCRTYTSQLICDGEIGERPLLSSIYYMLSNDEPIGFFHRNKSDIIHYFHLGSSIEYVLISPDGVVNSIVLGQNILQGELLQLLVPGGWWKASRLVGSDFGLISEAVSPGFDYRDNELGTKQDLKILLDKDFEIYKELIKSS